MASHQKYSKIEQFDDDDEKDNHNNNNNNTNNNNNNNNTNNNNNNASPKIHQLTSNFHSPELLLQSSMLSPAPSSQQQASQLPQSSSGSNEPNSLEAPPPSQHSPTYQVFTPFYHLLRDFVLFRLLWIGSSISQFGDLFNYIATAELITTFTDSTWALSGTLC